jgi:hypothetical protein
MKNYERRATGQFPYFKLATFDPISLTYRDGKVAYPTKAGAISAAAKPGKYRVSEVNLSGRIDFEPFEITLPHSRTARPVSPVAV